MRGVALLLVAGACGRVAFDPVAIHGDGAAATDAGDASTVTDDGANAGLLLHFEFETTTGLLTDSAPPHHVATCTSCPTSAAGRVGAAAASFAGAQCVTIADAPDLHPATFTFALWMSSTTAQRSTTFSRPENGATDTTNTFEVYVDVMNMWNIGVSSMYVTAGPVLPNQWHHVAGTYDGTQLTGYVDGASIGSVAAPAAVYETADQDLIGCDVNIGNQEEKYSGAIDDVRLYDHVLTAAEIQTLAM